MGVIKLKSEFSRRRRDNILMKWENLQPAAQANASHSHSSDLQSANRVQAGVPHPPPAFTLTLDVELYGRVGHPNDVLCDAGQLKVVVVSTDVDQGQVDGVDVGPV